MRKILIWFFLAGMIFSNYFSLPDDNNKRYKGVYSEDGNSLRINYFQRELNGYENWEYKGAEEFKGGKKVLDTFQENDSRWR